MTETYTPRHAENTPAKKEKEKKASFSERHGRKIGKLGVSLLVGSQLLSSFSGLKDHGDPFYNQKKMFGIETAADPSSLHDISDLMQRTSPGGPEMQKYEHYRSVDAAADLRHEVAAEYGLHDIDPRPAQAEIVKAKNLDDIDRALEAFSEQAGIKVSLLKSDQDASAQLTADNDDHYMVKFLRTDAVGQTFTMYKANALNALDGIASFPKEAYEEASNSLEQIQLTAGVYTPNEHKGGVYIGSRKSIYVPLTWYNGDLTAEAMRHEIGHAEDHEQANRGLISFRNDRGFASIQSDSTNPDDEYASQYAKDGGTPEDRAETLSHAFSELHPSFKLKSGNNAYDARASHSLQIKEALIFSRIDALKPGMGKFLARTAPYSANSALTYMPELTQSSTQN